VPTLVYILGCNHSFQVATQGIDDGKESQRHHYNEELKILANRYRFDLYCEEIRHSDFSIAERFAINRRKRYVDIDLPKELRPCFQIPDDYAVAGKHPSGRVAEWHKSREEFMFNRAVDRMSAGTNALVVCGDEHWGALRGRFEILGFRVNGESLLSKPWYDPRLYSFENL
jgi:hypothetical protein